MFVDANCEPKQNGHLFMKVVAAEADNVGEPPPLEDELDELDDRDD